MWDPVPLSSSAPMWTMMLSSLLNTRFDKLFYDVHAIPATEWPALAPARAGEGSFLLVAPSAAERAVMVFPTIEAFVEGGGDQAAALAIAGAGSSALGAAALARNVADALGRPVAAVVAGASSHDTGDEGLGGVFWFGAVNHWRYVSDLTGMRVPPLGHAGGELRDLDDGAGALGGDVRALEALLLHPALSFDLVVGHSKGNLVIAEALTAVRERDPMGFAGLCGRLAVVTLSAIIFMPAGIRTFDVIGGSDSLGAVNSRWWIPAEMVLPGVHHTTNPQYAPMHLPVTSVVRNFAERRRQGLWP